MFFNKKTFSCRILSRNWGLPPSPLCENLFCQKLSWGFWGDTPPSLQKQSAKLRLKGCLSTRWSKTTKLMQFIKNGDKTKQRMRRKTLQDVSNHLLNVHLRTHLVILSCKLQVVAFGNFPHIIKMCIMHLKQSGGNINTQHHWLCIHKVEEQAIKFCPTFAIKLATLMCYASH